MSYKAAILAALAVGVLCFNASAGCGRWVVRDNTDYLKDPLMDVNDPATDAPNITATQGSAPEADVKTQSGASSSNTTPNPDLSGKWYEKATRRQLGPGPDEHEAKSQSAVCSILRFKAFR
ncbi:MAG: hypothetical protein ABR985_18790 [Methanotrichaceae archaeon]